MSRPITKLLGILALGGILTLSMSAIFKDEIRAYISPDAVKKEKRAERRWLTSGADKQLSHFFQQRGYPDPTYLDAKYLAGRDQAIRMRAEQALTRTGGTTSASWTSIGPSTGIGGRILALTIDPANYNNVFIGTASGGIYKTTNGGTNWTFVPNGQGALAIGDITYHPSNSQILLAGTGEVYRSDTSNVGYNVWKARGTYGVGILRSTNGGATWTRTFNKTMPQMFAIQEIQFAPSDHSIVYAAGTDGMYKSLDAGITWTRTWAKTYVRDLVVHPTNADIVVATVGNLSNQERGIFRSTDGGNTFTQVTSGLPTAFPGYIKIESQGANRIYASIGRGGSNNELYLSDDFGLTWVAKASSSHCGGQYWFGHALAIDPNNIDRVVMGGVNYYTYTSTSTTASTGTKSAFASGVHADVHDIEFQPGSSDVIWIACDGGVYKANNGSTFNNMNSGISAVQFYASIAATPSTASPNIFIGGLQDNGTIRYNGSSWSSTAGGDGGPAAFHPTNASIAVYSTDARGVFYSTDGGLTESQPLLNMGYQYAGAWDHRTAFMAPLAISRSNPSYVYVASDNLHISSNGGSSYTRADPTVSTNFNRPIDAAQKPAIALAVSPTTYNKVYVSTSPFAQLADDRISVTGLADIRVSTNAHDNAAYTFTSIRGNLPDRFVNDIAIAAANDNEVYVVLGGFGSSHVYKTSNASLGNATVWTDIGAGLPDVPFHAIFIDPLRPNLLYAGGDMGIYVSPNGGGTWYDYNNGFSENEAIVMDIQKTADNRLLVATHGKGAYVGPLYSGTLPVSFRSLTGEAAGAVNRLAWTVTAEKEATSYDVERSTSGNAYTKIGTVPASSRTAFTYNDPVSAQTTFYYRIRSTNLDGSHTYSQTVAVRRAGADGMEVLGNPFASTLQLRFSNARAEDLTVRLYSASGRLVRQQRVHAPAGTSVYTLNGLAILPAGMYTVEAAGNGFRWTAPVLHR